MIEQELTQPGGRSILVTGWTGLCSSCARVRMFRSWLKSADRCEVCELDYGFASPDDGPAFFSLCFVAFPLIFFIVCIQVSIEPFASQFVTGAVEAGTVKLWSPMNSKQEKGTEREAPDA